MSGFGVKTDFLDILKNLAEATDENDPIWQGENLGTVLNNIVLALNQKGDVFTDQDNKYTGVNYFDLTNSQSFTALDTPDPLTIDPTYGLFLSADQAFLAAEEIAFFDQFCVGDIGFLQDNFQTLIARRDGLLKISTNNGVSPNPAEYGDIELVSLNSNVPGFEGGSILSNGNEICAIETGENADGKWEIHYDSRGRILSIEQNIRVTSSAGGAVDIDFPLDWDGFEYTGSSVISQDLPPGTGLVPYFVASNSDNDSFEFAVIDAVSQTFTAAQADLTFKGYPSP